jgi:hypothetical protein
MNQKPQSNENSFLQTTQQLAGVESIGTTRLINLRSWQADIHNSSVDKIWVMEKINKRSYLQQKIGVQILKIWHTFQSIPNSVELVLSTGLRVPIFKGNWTEDTLANYLTTNLPGIAVSYDPYQFQFRFCPSISLASDSTANPYLGFPLGQEVLATQQSAFPPVALRGPQCINIWTNFTMNNIPVSQFLACIPINTTYGNYIIHTNYDSSESTLCLESDITNIRVILKDDYGNDLFYPDQLGWEIVFAMVSTIPEGFSPLEM